MSSRSPGLSGGGGPLPENATLDSHVRRWERGAVAPSERYKLLYCAAFGIRADQYGQVLPPAPPGQDGQVPPQPAADAGPARPMTQPGPAAAGSEPPLCLSRLVRLVAQAVIDGVTCHCVAYGTPVGQAVPAGLPEAEEDPAGHLIAAAYQRGCDIDAIAAVCGMSRPQVRSVLKQAGTGAWT